MKFPKYQILIDLDYDSFLSTFKKALATSNMSENDCVLIPLGENKSYLVTNYDAIASPILTVFPDKCKELGGIEGMNLVENKPFSIYFGNFNLALSAKESL